MAENLDRSDRLFGEVNINNSLEKSQVIPKNETWKLRKVHGHSPYNNDNTRAILKFGDEVLFITHGDCYISEYGEELVGDGTKELTIILENDTGKKQIMA